MKLPGLRAVRAAGNDPKIIISGLDSTSRGRSNYSGGQRRKWTRWIDGSVEHRTDVYVQFETKHSGNFNLLKQISYITYIC